MKWIDTQFRCNEWVEFWNSNTLMLSCHFEPVILVQWTKDLWLMCIVSKHLEKVLSVLKNVHFDHQLWIMCLEQGSPDTVLEGRCPVEFSSNPNQTHLKKLINVLLGILEISRQVCWGKLELNSAGHRPSRIKFGDPWSRVLKITWRFCY